jgi:Ca2+-binding EF-hand superfamily protein
MAYPGYGGAQAGYGQQPQQVYGGGVPQGIDPNVYQWFVSVDMDRSGKISAQELQTALGNAPWARFSAETCRIMIGMFDRDRTGTIELHEFQALWNYIGQWRAIFDQFDRDRSGAIDGSELNTMLTQMGYRLSPQFIQCLLYRYDPQRKQSLQFDGFVQSCVLLKTLTDAFRQKDTQMRGAIQISYEEFLSAVFGSML